MEQAPKKPDPEAEFQFREGDIDGYRLHRYSDKLIAWQIVKEFLIFEVHRVIEQEAYETYMAQQGKVSPYARNILSIEFEKREKHLRSLLNVAIKKCNDIKATK